MFKNKSSKKRWFARKNSHLDSISPSNKSPVKSAQKVFKKSVVKQPKRTSLKTKLGKSVNKRRYTNKFGVTRIGRYKYSEQWPKLSRDIKRERGNKCERCHSISNLETHHIIPISRGGRDTRSNLIVLCGTCHDKRHIRTHKLNR